MGDFRQRVGLVHELRQLARAEEFAHRSSRRFGVDQVLRHDRVDLDGRHPLFDRAFHPQQADAVLIFHQFANRTHPAVAEVVDVVDLALAITQFGQGFDTSNNIGTVKRALGIRAAQIQTHVHFHPANSRQIITLGIKEQRVEQLACRFNGRRLARTHHAVDVHQCCVTAHVLVGGHGVAHVGTDVDVVDVQHRNLGDALIQQQLQRPTLRLAVAVVFHRQLITSFDPNLAGFFVDDVFADIAADDMIIRHQQISDLAGFSQIACHPRRHFLASLADHFAGIGVDDIIGRAGAPDTVREELGDPAFVLLELEHDGLVIGIHDAFLVHPQRVKQRGDRQFPATVDAREHDVFGVKLKVQPRAAIRNDPAGEQQLTAGVRLALVMVKEHAGRTVHLRHDHALGAVHHEGAVAGHQGHVAHVNVLLFDILDRPSPGGFINIKHDQTQGNFQRRGIGHVARLALVHVILRLFQLVLDEFKHGGLIEVLDREHRLERALNAFAIQRLVTVARAQEQIIGRFLNLNQVRHFQNFTNFAEITADSFLANVSLRHVRRNLSISPAGFPSGHGKRADWREGEGSIHATRPLGWLPNLNRTLDWAFAKAQSKTR